MRKPKSDAFDIDLSEADRNDLANDLAIEVEDAFRARSSVIDDGGTISLLHWFYEQGQSDPDDRPFEGAADLTSPFITESVDALRARLLKTIFGVEPFCTVDGWGDSAKRAPIVEAFHEWQVFEEGLPEELAKTIHGALLSDCFVLEVRERIETRRMVEKRDVALELHPETQAPIFAADKKGKVQPKLQQTPDGEFVDAQEGQPAATIEVTHTKTRRLGPEYDVIAPTDFVFLPGHAKNRRQVYGTAKRLWMRVPDIQERVKDGVFDMAAAEALGESSDRELTGDVPPPVDSIQNQRGPAAEKELFEISLKRDLDGDGREEWYVATLGARARTLLRLKLDTFVMKVGKPRCVPIVLFPRADSVYGYTYAEKLLTLAEEHTAQRNMKADRGALATNKPLMVLQTALWDPDTQPIGVGRTITVRDMNEVREMQVADIPPGMAELEQLLWMMKERVSGLSDVATIGTQARQSRTLGQDEIIAAASNVRVDEPLSHLRTAIATIMELRHAIWVETLEGDGKGLEAPAEVVQALDARGVADFGGKFTAEMLKGKFRFKPYGSSETADAGRRTQMFNQGLIALGNLAKMFPMFALMFQNPDVVKTVAEEWARVYKIRNPSVFLKALVPPPQMGLPQAGGMDAAGGQPPGPPGMLPPGAPAPGGAVPPEMASMLAALTGGPHGVQ
jgi:hypothetical protein